MHDPKLLTQRAYKYQDQDKEDKKNARENTKVIKHCHINS